MPINEELTNVARAAAGRSTNTRFADMAPEDRKTLREYVNSDPTFSFEAADCWLRSLNPATLSELLNAARNK